MLDYKILNNKPYIDKDNDKYIDLLAKTYKGYIPDNESIDYNIVVVNQYYVARPDLVSLAIYGDDCYGDIICKLNGISNPFELNEDDILILPSIDIITSLIDYNPQSSEFVTEKNNTIASTNSINDKRKKINEKRSANDMTLGNSNYVIDRSLGLVFY